MFDLKKIVRANILALEPYSSARHEYKGKDAIFLDANENPFGKLNRYPDPNQERLKKELSILKSIPNENIFVGNGSDEIIDLAFRIFCNPGIDKALTFSPTYGMYDVSACINNIELLKIPLDDQFQVDYLKLEPYFKMEDLKLIFICSPNNPTGNSISSTIITKILENFKGIVIIDEAYIDFSTAESWIKKSIEYPNLIVSQTFSKAWGLAAARVGTAYTHENTVTLFNKVKPPYNVSQLNQEAAINALANIEVCASNKQVILNEKINLIASLNQLKQVIKIYPSDANFLLVKVVDANKLYSGLVHLGVITRNRNMQVENCVRITIGSPEENILLIKALKNLEE